MSRQAQLLILWAVCSLVAALVALQFSEAAYEEKSGTWVPVSNDSFYHARRILDAADPAVGLQQFDSRIHVPEGSWITWPWAYDWLMARALQGWQKLNPETDPMAFLGHVPVYWTFVNAAILLGICVTLGLAMPWIVLVMSGFALSPLTMLLHGVGIIDHHYIEYTFVLLTLYTGLRWLSEPAKTQNAVILGVTLGSAPAFHNGLFILQLPVLVTLALLWLRRTTPPQPAMAMLSTALILTTLLILLPADAFRIGQFSFAVLSWFHLYIAAASTLLISCFGRLRCSTTTLILLPLIGIALLVPMWGEMLGGGAFLSGEITLLDRITEVKSPLQMVQTDPGFTEVLSYYSLFGLLAPLLLAIYLWRVCSEKNAAQLYFAVMTVLGLTLLLLQFRLHYFGTFALLLGWVVLVNEKFTFATRYPVRTTATVFVLLAGAFGLGVVQKITVPYNLGLDPAYEDGFGLLNTLHTACQKNPGIVLSDNNFGHYIRYHTDCSVIANNFLMTPLHEEKVLEVKRLLSLSPEQLLAEIPEGTRYIFARLDHFYARGSTGDYELTSSEHLRKHNPRLFFELNSRVDLPARYRILEELPLDESRNLTRARLIEILPAN
jgi:hypothetical protein